MLLGVNAFEDGILAGVLKQFLVYFDKYSILLMFFSRQNLLHFLLFESPSDSVRHNLLVLTAIRGKRKRRKRSCNRVKVTELIWRSPSPRGQVGSCRCVVPECLNFDIMYMCM